MTLRLTIYETNRFERLRTARRFARRFFVGAAVVLVGVFAAISMARGAERGVQASVEQPLSPEAIGRATLIDALAPVVSSRGAIATVNVTSLDARRSLAPCARIAGFIPPGARLVGKTLVGIRCLEGATWQTFLTADVRVEASVWQTTRALRAGDALGAADLIRTQALLTTADIEEAANTTRQTVSGTPGSSTGAPARGLAAFDGRAPAPLGSIVQRTVAMGRALAAADLRDAGRINPGDAVRVVYTGEGFSVSSEGHSVGAADPGASVLIRLTSGTVVNGTLLADHRVELPR